MAQIAKAAGTENQVVGKVFILNGTVKAVSPDGTVRVLAPNSPVYANERIITESDGSVSIQFDGPPVTQMDLGRMTEVLVDQDVYAGVTPEVVSEAAAQAEQVQQSLLQGDQPIDLEATAAGGAAGAGGGHPVVNFALDGGEVTPGSGAGTTGIDSTTVGTLGSVFAPASPIADGTPTGGLTTAVTLDDEGLPGGIPGGDGDVPGELTTTSGILPHDFGTDGAGSIGFASMDGTTGELGAEEVSYSWNADTNTLTASSERGEIFTVVVNPATGAYTLQLLLPVMHEPGGGENDALADLTYTVTDADGDTATGTLTINIDDDTPTIPAVGVDTDATNGSGIDTVLDVHAGDVITFNWSFDADDYTPFNDFGFVVIDGEVTKLADISQVGSYNATGWVTFTYVATEDGPLQIGFGVMNTGDTSMDSHLLIDKLAVNGEVVQSFESGDLTGWGSTGSVTVVTSHDEGGGTPTDGAYMVRLTSSGVYEGALESFFGLPEGAMDAASETGVGSIYNADTLDDEGLGGIPGGYGDVEGELITTSGTLPHDFGADGAGSVGFASMDGQTGLVGIETVTYSWDAETNTLTAEGPRGDLFTVEVDPGTGAYTLTLLDNVLHDTSGPPVVGEDQTGDIKGPQAYENDATVQLTYTVTDADGDSVNGTFNITINDDIPVASIELVAYGEDHQPVSLAVDESMGSDDVPGALGQASAVLVTSTGSAYGADGAGTTAFSLTVAAGADSGLATTDGTEIYLYDNAGVIEGRVGGSTGAVAFDFTIDSSTGNVTLTQHLSLHHPDGTDANDPVNLDTGVITAMVTVTDGDGDVATDTVDVSGLFTFYDDGPVASIELVAYGEDHQPVSLAVDESMGSDDVPGALGQASAVLVTSTGSAYGADGAGTTAFSLTVAAGADSGLATTDGTEIYLYDNAGVIEGRVGGATGAVAFDFTIDSSTGNVTLTQHLSLHHPDGTDANDPVNLDTGVITAMVTVTDGDGDVATDTVDVSGLFTFYDDGPVASIELVAYGEDHQPVSLAVDESMGSDDVPGALGQASAVLVTSTGSAYGADGAGTTAFSLTVAAGADSGLATTDGTEIYLYDNAGVIEGRVGGATGAVAFDFTIDSSTGNVTLTQHLSLHHPDGTDANDPVNLDTGVITAMVTVTDGDGDVATDTVDVSGLFTFYDDGPQAQPDTAVVNEPISTYTEVSGTYNVTIVLDTSGSMDQLSKIGLAKDAINNLLTQYGGPGGANAANVHVLIVGFDAASYGHPGTENSGWLSLADAQAYVSDPSHLQAGGNTNYELALDATMAAYDTSTPDADTNVVYFLSDGEPTAGGGSGHHLSGGDITAWEGWLASHDMDAYAIGIGTTDAADQDLLAVAYSEDPLGAANTPIIVDNPADLSATLHDIVVPGPDILDTVEGNVVTGLVTGQPSNSPDTPGADGATVTAISYIGTDGNLASAVVTGAGVTVQTALGDLTISADGDYSYKATAHVDEDTNDVFTYTLTDGDGDISQSTLTITVDSLPEAYDVNDSIMPQITINTGNYESLSDMVKITVGVTEGDLANVKIGHEEAQLLHDGVFGIKSDADGGNGGRFNEINHIADSTNHESEVMIFELQNDPGEAAAGKIATHATVEITGFCINEDMGQDPHGNEQGSYELFNNGVSVQAQQIFNAGDGHLGADGVYTLDITYTGIGGFDEIRFGAVQGTNDPAGGDSSDYNIKSVTFDLMPVKEGNLLTDSTPAGTFGGDLAGAHVQSIAGVGGGTADTAISPTDDLTATGKYGGTLHVESDGDYIYTPPAVIPTGDVTESFSFTLIDGDGDTASAQLDMLIDDPNHD